MAGLDATVVITNVHAHTSIEVYFFLFLFHCSQVVKFYDTYRSNIQAK